MGIDAGSVYSSVRIRLDQLDADVKGVFARMDQLEGRITKQLGGATDKATKSFSAMNLAGVAAFIGIGSAVKTALTQFTSFEQSIANVASVAGATADEMRALEKAAFDAGATTRFSASESADALYYLASAGMDAGQSIAALDGVLQLAGATQSELAFTAEAVSATISQYGLDAADAGRISNVFAAAIGNSQATMGKLAESFRYAGPVAGALGVSLEETTGALQILYDAGFQGEQAGTIIRNLLSDLVNSAGPAADKLKNLGINMADVNPETVGLSGAIRALQKANLSAADALNVFGDRAGPGLITLLAKGADEVDRLTEAVTGTNAAATAYAIQNDTLAGSIDETTSAAEAAGIKFGEEFNPILRDLLGLAKGALDLMAALPGPIKAFGGVAAVAAVGVGVLSAAMGVLGISMAPLLPFLLPILAATVAIGGAATIVSKAISDEAERTAELGDIAGLTVGQIEELDAALSRGSFGGTFESATEQVDALSEALGISKTKVIEVGLASEGVTEEYRAQLEALLPIVQRQEEIERLSASMYSWENKANAELLARKKIQDDLAAAEQAAKDAAAKAEIQAIARVKGVEDARKEALKKYTEEQDRAQRSFSLGLIDELGLQDRLLGAARSYADQLLAIGYDGQLVIKEWTDKNGKLVRGIQEGDRALNEVSTNTIPNLVAQVEALTKAQEDAEKAKKEAADAAEKAEKDAADAREVAAKKAADLDAAAAGDAAVWVGNLKTASGILAETTGNIARLKDANFDAMAAEKAARIEEVRSLGISREAEDYLIAKIEEEYKLRADKAAFDAYKKNVQDAINYASQLYSALSDLVVQLYQNQADAQLEAIEKVQAAEKDALDEKQEGEQEALDAELQQRLYAAGLAEAATIEQLRAELEAAREAGDQEAEDEAEQALEKATIEQEFQEKKTALEKKQADESVALADKQAKEKAEINYKAEMAAWVLKGLSVAADAAKAIAGAISAPPFWPLNMGSVLWAGGIGAAQVATVAASKPRLAYATGGIVPGARTSGDSVPAMLKPREMILNDGQQAALWNMIAQQGAGSQAAGGGMPAIIQVMLSDRIIAAATVQLINDRVYTIDARSIR